MTDQFAAGFQMSCLFQERKHINVAALEKFAHVGVS